MKTQGKTVFDEYPSSWARHKDNKCFRGCWYCYKDGYIGDIPEWQKTPTKKALIMAGYKRQKTGFVQKSMAEIRADKNRKPLGFRSADVKHRRKMEKSSRQRNR